MPGERGPFRSTTGASLTTSTSTSATAVAERSPSLTVNTTVLGPGVGFEALLRYLTSCSTDIKSEMGAGPRNCSSVRECLSTVGEGAVRS